MTGCVLHGGARYLMKGSSAGPSLSPIIIVLLALGIVTGLVIPGTVAMGTIVDTSYSNVDVTVRVAGDDVPHISRLHAHIDGVPEPSPEKNYHQTIVVGQPIVFEDLAAGVGGFCLRCCRGGV